MHCCADFHHRRCADLLRWSINALSIDCKFHAPIFGETAVNPRPNLVRPGGRGPSNPVSFVGVSKVFFALRRDHESNVDAYVAGRFTSAASIYIFSFPIALPTRSGADW